LYQVLDKIAFAFLDVLEQVEVVEVDLLELVEFEF
jgi:hypothetical protein